MKYILYILLFLLPSEILAQEFNISGTVVDLQNIPVAYANVLLLAEDNSIITGTSSLENGSFNLFKLKPQTYTLKVTFVGYKDFAKTIKLSGDLNTVNVVLEENTESLKEVTITSTKPTLKKEADRLIFNVANTALSEGNLLEVLRSTPGVLILDNNITVKNSTPTVYINDRKVNLSASEVTQLLENSPANTIKKVEVITNPPAKYDAESGAVINIVMSRNLITGYRGNIFTNYTQGVFPRYNIGLNQFYKTKKININLNYSFTKSKVNRVNKETIQYFNTDDFNPHWYSEFNRNTRSKTHAIKLNFDYLIDDNSTLSLSSNLFLLPFFDYQIKGKSNVTFDAFFLPFTIDSRNSSKDEKYNLAYDLDFVHRFKNNDKLSINAHFTNYDYMRNQNVNSIYNVFENADDFSTAFNINNNQNTDILTSQLDYNTSFSDKASFSTGLKFSNVKTESDITQFDINTTTNEQTLNNENTDEYNYDESIFAGYINYENSIGKLSLSGGLRFEQTDVDGESISSNLISTQSYFELFPTVNITFQASKKLNLYANYKRSIDRPSYQSLNPFNFFFNDNIVNKGNPTLQPAFSNHFVLGTTISEIYTIEAYYRDTKNKFFELPIQDNENNILVYSPVNIEKSKEYGLDFITYFNVFDDWSIYFLTSFYNIEDASFFDNNFFRNNRWSNYSVLSNNLSFLKDKSLKLNFAMTYISKNQQGFRTSESLLNTNLSIKKSIFKKKGSLFLTFSDLFNTQDFDVAFKLENQNNRNQINLDNRYIKLGFNYKFGNTTLKTNERVKQLNERERLEK
ncbi:TonB-dependent receptor [uncultured Lacinutrix sp.]|uniref:TonB-dependent receptor domain-containing protein n=1 Tax=uncultured Lacinutrix sp. TaxID=574032 RepID=UPI002616029E|nr:TonB-dependent receptor [uncultured Lacinutrix sp.]